MDAMEVLRKQPADILFLEIQMPVHRHYVF
jgi:hypothetical protein